MSFQLPSKTNVTETESLRWSGVAVLIEAMLLLVFLIASLAILTQVFSAAVVRADESAQLTTAVAEASNTAEQFAANPANVSEERIAGDLLIVCDVDDEKRTAGTLYHAEISVYATNDSTTTAQDGAPIYFLSTSRFESEVE